MGVDETHLVCETVADTLDHVLDGGADSTQAGDVLATSVPDDKLDLVDGRLGGGGGDGNAHGHVDVGEVLLDQPGPRFEREDVP